MFKKITLALFCASSLCVSVARADEPGWPPEQPNPCKPCWIEPWLCKNPPCPPGPRRIETDPKADPSGEPPKPLPACCHEQPVRPLGAARDW